MSLETLLPRVLPEVTLEQVAGFGRPSRATSWCHVSRDLSRNLTKRQSHQKQKPLVGQRSAPHTREGPGLGQGPQPLCCAEQTYSARLTGASISGSSEAPSQVLCRESHVSSLQPGSVTAEMGSKDAAGGILPRGAQSGPAMHKDE